MALSGSIALLLHLLTKQSKQLFPTAAQLPCWAPCPVPIYFCCSMEWQPDGMQVGEPAWWQMVFFTLLADNEYWNLPLGYRSFEKAFRNGVLKWDDFLVVEKPWGTSACSTGSTSSCVSTRHMRDRQRRAMSCPYIPSLTSKHGLSHFWKHNTCYFNENMWNSEVHLKTGTETIAREKER